ncbi:hypothetical protein CQA53_07020 [Helicobacter didelphidarum]|uniref:Uncharacterized protein n=1 Tax=Helicobacter didelphidarum TaxID=2040648 RepID=A0A3D8IJC4_9HELI|nr:hypothetical protein [Helicobacter didelphidarum]RDU64986.1 hypothetical protein CQA53_07020 [Helicobacter didelphidarum]
MLNITNMMYISYKKLESIIYSKQINDSIVYKDRNIKQHKTTRLIPLFKTFLLGGILTTCVYGQGKADDYMRASLENLFDNTSAFECDGNNRSAICTTPRYDTNVIGFSLKDFRYTVDYLDTRVIERVSGSLETTGFESEKSQFLPKAFECSDFTQVNDEKKQVNEQLLCTITSDYYSVWFRVKAKSTSPLLQTNNIMDFMQQTTAFLNKISKRLSNIDDKDKFQDEVNKISKTLSKIDTNIYSIEAIITKPELPQKIYEYLFADMLDNEQYMSEMRSERYNQLSRTLYNSGVGYIYGHAMGYVWGNDKIDERTKESLNRLLTAFRDSAMLDSNVRKVYIKLTNRTKLGFNLGNAFNRAMQKVQSLHNSRIKKEYAGRSINVFDGDFLNRYRIESGVMRAKNNIR